MPKFFLARYAWVNIYRHSEYISVVLCLSAGFLQTKNFVLIPIVKQNTNSWRRRAEWARERERLSKWGAEKWWRRRMKKIHKTQKLPLPLYTVARSHLLYTRFQKKKRKEGSKRAWAATIQSLSSHEKGRRWERYKCVFVLKSIHRDVHFPCIQFFFFFFFSIRFYFFIFPHSVFGEERLLLCFIWDGRGIIE